MGQALVHDFFIILPLIVMVISFVIVSRIFHINISTLVPFFAVTFLFSSFVLVALLTLPLFGVLGIFYMYVEVINRRGTLVWTYLVMGQKREVAFLGTYTLLSWLILGGLLGTYLSHRLFDLSFKRAVYSYFSTVGLSVILTWFLAWTSLYACGVLP